MPREPAPLSGETTAHSEEDWFKPCYFNPWSQPFWLAKCHTCSCSFKKNTNNSQLIKLTAPNMPTRIRYIPKSWPIKKPQAAPRHAIARFFPLDDDLLIWHVDPALEVVAQLTQGRRAREATNGVLLAMENPVSLSLSLSIYLYIYNMVLLKGKSTMNRGLPIAMFTGDHPNTVPFNVAKTSPGLGQKLSTAGSKPGSFKGNDAWYVVNILLIVNEVNILQLIYYVVNK